MAIPNSFLDELVRRTDIADLVGGYVKLTKRSGANLFGLCPFHHEKTPSFSVSPDKQIYHCFGCGKGGGAINFVMEIERLPFTDAVELLAKRAGMRVPENDMPDEVLHRRARILQLNRDAARFFHDTLSGARGARGAAAVSYLERRGISRKMTTAFGLGAAPDAWGALMEAMTAAGYSQQELLAAGLIKKSDKSGGLYDTFRNRLMFPVIDVRGSVIGFSGRILGEGEPKYLNSPDTPVFNKSRNLFALNLAKKSKAGSIILAEGNIDVVALHQAGFDSAVASLGTSLTEEQARLIARYADTAVIAYDSDEAGIKAAQRAIGILEKTGIAVKVITMRGAKDPDEFIRKYGPNAFGLLIERSENHIEYRLLTIQGRYDLGIDDGRIGYLAEATQLLAGLMSEVEREIYAARVAKAAGVSAEAVRNEIGKAIKRRLAAQRKTQERSALRPAAALQPEDRAIRYKNERSAAAEEGIIRCLIQDPGLIDEAARQALRADEFSSEFLGRLYTMLRERDGEGRASAPAAIAATLTGAEASHFARLIGRPESAAGGHGALLDYINKIRLETLRQSVKAADSEDSLLEIRKRYKETGKGVGG